MGHLTLKQVFFESVVSLSYIILASHLVRAFNDISLATFEITGPQMVLTMKLTTFAWNVYDGRQPLEVRQVNLHYLVLTDVYRPWTNGKQRNVLLRCPRCWHFSAMRRFWSFI